MVNFVVWLLVGGIIGWIASYIMRVQTGVMLNIVVGIVGAFLAGLLLTPLLGITTINQNNVSLPGLFVSLAGAVILLVLLNVLRGRGRGEREYRR
jgi:uncharacterized membrane protein YeaQ/YmgE (transglycosylase-associated protein family)